MNLLGSGVHLARSGILVERLKRWASAHPVLFIFIAVLVIRTILAVALSAIVGMEPFPDTKLYDRLASDLAAGAYHQWDHSEAFRYERLAGYALPLGVLYRIFGAHLLLGQLLAALFGAVAAAAVCRLALLAAGRRVALLAGSIMVLFPSHVLWSSVAYEDSAVWAASAGAALLVAFDARARGFAWCRSALGWRRWCSSSGTCAW